MQSAPGDFVAETLGAVSQNADAEWDSTRGVHQRIRLYVGGRGHDERPRQLCFGCKAASQLPATEPDGKDSHWHAGSALDRQRELPLGQSRSRGIEACFNFRTVCESVAGDEDGTGNGSGNGFGMAGKPLRSGHAALDSMAEIRRGN